MRRGGRILTVLGLLLGLLTATVTFVTLSQTPTTQQAVPTKDVVVATQNIGTRTEITIDMVDTVKFPEEAIPAGAFESRQAVVGKVALYPIYPGQPILPPMIINKPAPIITPTGSIASFIVPEGKVAMAFEISTVSSVAGAIQPGDTIDILVTLQPAGLPPVTPRSGTATTGTEGLPVTQLTLQDVQVLHVGAWAIQDRNAPASGILTLALDRQDALVLKSAREQGQIDLVLRRVGDRKTYDLEPVTLQYLNRRFKFNLLPGTTGTTGTPGR